MNRRWTKEELIKALNATDLQAISQELGRTEIALKRIQQDYLYWRKHPEIAKSHGKLFREVGTDRIVNQFLRGRRKGFYFKKFTLKGKLMNKKINTTIDTVKTIINGKEAGTSYKEIAEKINKTPKRVEFLCGAYKHWKETGKVYAGNNRISYLFYQLHKERNLPIPEKYNPEKYTTVRNYQPEIHEETQSEIKEPEIKEDDSLAKLDTLFENFKTELVSVIVNVAIEQSKTSLKEEYDKGFKAGQESGVRLYRKQSIAEMIKNRLKGIS